MVLLLCGMSMGTYTIQTLRDRFIVQEPPEEGIPPSELYKRLRDAAEDEFCPGCDELCRTIDGMESPVAPDSASVWSWLGTYYEVWVRSAVCRIFIFPLRTTQYLPRPNIS